MLTRWQPTARPVAWPSSHCHLPSGRPTPRARRPRVAHADPHAAWTNQRVPTLQPPMLVAVGSHPRGGRPRSPATLSKVAKKWRAKKSSVQTLCFGASAGARDLQAAGTICVCVIYSILCRDGPDGPNGDVSGPDGHGTAASTACTVDGRQRGSSRLQSLHLPLPSIGACRAWGCMFACEIESLRVRYPVRGRAQGR